MSGSGWRWQGSTRKHVLGRLISEKFLKGKIMAEQNQQATGGQAALVRSRQDLNALLAGDKITEMLGRVVTKGFSIERTKAQVLIAVGRNPKLLGCTKLSLLESVIRGAELGLRFDGTNGEAYLVPFKNRCVFIIGYRGQLALVRRTGQVLRIEARCVREKDYFKVDFGSGQQLTHRPCLGAERGDIICAYALAQLKDGSVQLETMTRAEIDAIRKRSPAANEGPWRTDYPAMCRKTVLRRLCKYLPFPTAFEDSLAAEEPAISEDQPRGEIETHDIVPENVDKRTGEIIDDTNQVGASFDNEKPAAVPADEPLPSGPQAPDQTDSGSLDEQKSKLINQIVSELGKLHPGDSIENQAAALKTLKHLFGQTQLSEIEKMPSRILEAGLEYLKGRAVAAEAGSGDIPF